MNSRSGILETLKTPGASDSSFPFLKSLVKDKFVASVAPSSLSVSNAICRNIDFSTAHTIVELGPGDGSITRQVLKNMHADASLFALETNENFVGILHSSFQDARLEILHEDAQRIEKVCRKKAIAPDIVISGIPFSLFSDEMALGIIKDVCAAMNPAGTFILYQAYLPPFFNAKRCRTLLSSCFQEKNIEEVYFNIPPLRVITVQPRLMVS